MNDDELAVLLSLRALGAAFERSTSACRDFTGRLSDVARVCREALPRLERLDSSLDLQVEGATLAWQLEPMAEPLEVHARKMETAVGQVRQAMELWTAARERCPTAPPFDELLNHLATVRLAAGLAATSIAAVANGGERLGTTVPTTLPITTRITVAARRVILCCWQLTTVVEEVGDTQL